MIPFQRNIEITKIAILNPVQAYKQIFDVGEHFGGALLRRLKAYGGQLRFAAEKKFRNINKLMEKAERSPREGKILNNFTKRYNRFQQEVLKPAKNNWEFWKGYPKDVFKRYPELYGYAAVPVMGAGYAGYRFFKDRRNTNGQQKA